MRDLASKEKVLRFLEMFGRVPHRDTRVYLTGGATAVLKGWRDATVDIDIKFDPEWDEMFRAIPKLKEDLCINVELAAPSDFIPVPAGWEERSEFVTQIGHTTFLHYDPYSQALAKIERGHQKDLDDVQAMLASGSVRADKLGAMFAEIEPMIYKYPALSHDKFAAAVAKIVEGQRD
jgi:hypothetical protein